MKRLLYILMLFLLPVVAFGKDAPQELFLKGNALYNKGQYAAALGVYKQITNAGYQSAAVYFNMGNAFYKTGEIPSALLYYEKAHKLAPGDEDINFNIRFANLKTTDKIEDAPEFFLSTWWYAFILRFASRVLAIWSVVLFLTASALLIVYFFAEGVLIKMISFYAALVLFICGITAIAVAERQADYFDSHKQAIIFNTSVTVKSGPVAQSGNLFILHEGTKVTVLGASNGWLKIKIGNGNVGWIKTGDAQAI